MDVTMPTAAAPAPAAPLTRDQLLALSMKESSYRFLRVALQALEQTPEDWDICLQVIRHYAVLGLVRPALEMIASLPPEIRAQLDAAGVPQQLQRVPNGWIPWQQLRPRFDANAAVLLQRKPQLGAMLEAACRDLEAIELYRLRDGNYQMSRFDERGQRVWLPRLADHKKESPTAEMPKTKGVNLAPPMLVEGLHYGWFLPGAMDCTRNLFLSYSAAVFIIEPNPVTLAAVLHLHDWRELLAEERLYIFAGPDAATDFARELTMREDLPMPTQHTHLMGWGQHRPSDTTALVQNAQKMRNTHIEQMMREIDAIYASRDVSWWAKRYASAGAADPLRVLMPVSRYTSYLKYCIRDLAQAFERKGVRTRIVMEPTDHSKMSGANYLEPIIEFQPDLVLIIDHMRCEYGSAISRNIPFVTWIQDQLPHLYSREAGESLGPLDFFVAAEIQSFASSYGYPAAQGLAWTAAGDDRQYSAEPIAEHNLAPYRCDFSFVSHQSKLPHAFLEEQIALVSGDANLTRYMECLHTLLLRDFREDPRTGCLRPAQRLLDEATELSGIKPRTAQSLDQLVLFFLHPLAELIFRQGTLEWVADYCDRTGHTLHLYGKGWDQHPRFARYARGPAANGEELRAIYQASRVNLQIIGGGCIHQRLLDGLLAGGFFLIRYSPFDAHHELVGQTLAAIEKYNVEPDRDYSAEQVPELAEALRKLALHHGGTAPGHEVRVPANHFAIYRAQAANGYRRIGGAVLPQYSQTSFASPGEFAVLADRFLGDATARASLAADMRSVVQDQYTYGTLLDNLLHMIQRRLRESADQQAEIGNRS